MTNHNTKTRKPSQIRTAVRAGGLNTFNHNGTKIRTRVRAGGGRVNHNTTKRA